MSLTKIMQSVNPYGIRLYYPGAVCHITFSPVGNNVFSYCILCNCTAIEGQVLHI